MTTAQDLIESAWRKVGDASPSATKLANSLESLNDMIAFMATQDLFVFALSQATLTLAADDAEYSVGDGGDIDITVGPPRRISAAFLRDTDGTDHPVEIIPKEKWNRITDKDAPGRPEKLCYLRYEDTNQMGTILLDKYPDSAYVLHVDALAPISEFESLSTTVVLPPEYRLMLISNLAVMLAPEEEVDLDPSVTFMASQTQKLLKRANSTEPPEAEYDEAIL